MRFRALGLAMAGLAAFAAAAAAQVLRFEPTGPTEPAFAGQEFGAVGRYERIRARATIALDPADPRNAVIADIAEAPRNAQGRVEAVADVVILRPADAARGNGTILLEVPNRGGPLALQLFNDAAPNSEQPGSGFLYRQGYTIVWVGWQADFTPAAGQLGIQVPVLTGVTGTLREENSFDNTTSPATIRLAYPVADPVGATLTVRARWDLPPQSPADLRFRFVTPRQVEVTRPAGFDAGALYTLTYSARDPMVLGMGFAAVRDVAAFLARDDSAANPLAGRVRRSLGFGVSQSGRFLRDFLYLGFNEDTNGRQVFDGINPHVAGSRRMYMNSRFARPDKAPRHPLDPAWTADAFPFSYDDVENPYTGERDGLLRRCARSNTCPRVMQTDTENEWWGAHASLVVTDLRGNHIDLPDGVRMYMISGTPHFAQPNATTGSIRFCALPTNPVHAGAPMRALLGHLEAWVRGEAPPPPSRMPSRASGTLVEAARAQPVTIAGLPFTGMHTAAAQVDPQATPLREVGRFPVFVPRLDADGMAIAGIRQPVLEAPRATYTGWNPRAEGFGPGVLCPLRSAVLPLAATRATRQPGDPRPSIEERYPTAADYVAAVRAAADRLVAERMLLAEDAAAMVAAAEAGRLAR